MAPRKSFSWTRIIITISCRHLPPQHFRLYRYWKMLTGASNTYLLLVFAPVSCNNDMVIVHISTIAAMDFEYEEQDEPGELFGGHCVIPRY